MGIDVQYDQSAFGGNVILSRLYHNNVDDWVNLEAHEIGESPGTFATSMWDSEGNSINSAPANDLATVVRWMLNYEPPKGWLEADTVPKHVLKAAGEKSWEINPWKEIAKTLHQCRPAKNSDEFLREYQWALVVYRMADALQNFYGKQFDRDEFYQITTIRE